MAYNNLRELSYAGDVDSEGSLSPAARTYPSLSSPSQNPSVKLTEEASQLSNQPEYKVSKDKDEEGKKTKGRKVSWLILLIWFVIITIIAFLILYAWKPELVQQTDSRNNPTGEASGAKVLVASLIVGAVLVFLLFIALTIIA